MKKKFQSFLAVAIVALGIGSNSNADITHGPDVTPYSDYQAFGASPIFAPAGWVRLSNTNNPLDVVMASGTKVSDNGFILAGHTMELWLNGSYNKMEVGFGLNYKIDPGEIYNITSGVFDPTYNGFGGSGRDVAFAFTDVVMNAPSALLYAGVIPSHADIWSAGYGMKGTPETGAIPSNGDKLGTINRISVDHLTGASDYFLTKFESPVSQYFNEFGSQKGVGDSGTGGLNMLGNDFFLSSVLSGVSTTVAYNQASLWSRIDYGTSTGILNDNKLTSVPEPASFVLFGTASCLMGLKRRRRKVV